MTEELNVLKDIEKWLKIIAIQEVRDELVDELTNENDDRQKELRTVFHLTNGENSSSEIEKYVSVSRRTVSKWQQKWANKGLLEKETKKSPYNSLLNLNEVGIDTPEIEEVDND